MMSPVLGLCHPHGRPEQSSQLLVSTDATPVIVAGIWGMNQQVEDSLSDMVPFKSINKSYFKNCFRMCHNRLEFWYLVVF